MPAIWALIVLVVVSVAGFELVGSKVEKFVVDVEKETAKTAKTILSPVNAVVLVCVVAGLFIVFGGLAVFKGGGSTA